MGPGCEGALLLEGSPSSRRTGAPGHVTLHGHLSEWRLGHRAAGAHADMVRLAGGWMSGGEVGVEMGQRFPTMFAERPESGQLHGRRGRPGRPGDGRCAEDGEVTGLELSCMVGRGHVCD